MKNDKVSGDIAPPLKHGSDNIATTREENSESRSGMKAYDCELCAKSFRLLEHF